MDNVDNELSLIFILFGFSYLMAFIYLILDPKADLGGGVDTGRLAEGDISFTKKTNVFYWILKWLVIGVLPHVWIIGFEAIYIFYKQGRHHKRIREDAEYLIHWIVNNTFSEIYHFDEDERKKEIEKLEKLYNLYGESAYDFEEILLREGNEIRKFSDEEKENFIYNMDKLTD